MGFHWSELDDKKRSYRSEELGTRLYFQIPEGSLEH